MLADIPHLESRCMAKNHQDTSTSLHPLSFEEAIRELTTPPKHEDSQAEESDSTKEACPGSETSKKQTSQRQKSSAD